MQNDQFQPEKLLAAGPAAKVYRGVESGTGRKVLIKALLAADETPHALDRERLQLFAPALMQMRHPHITGLLTLILTEEEFAIVSDFMPGANIRALAATRQIPAADLRALAVQLMQALLVGEHLRQPHGDPKPSNIIIADHPAGGLFLQLQDWGLSLTRQVHPAETLWFRAPERHLGGMPTSQSDLFTAAASLFCLATNTAPVQGEVAEDLARQWQGFHAGYVLQHLRPDIDPPLRDWLAWLMQPHPHARPQCVAQALDTLMLSMHTGFMPMPLQAPQMMPGSQTMPLVAAPAPTPVSPAAVPVPEVPTMAAPASAAPKESVPAPPAPPPAGAPRPRPVAAKPAQVAATVTVAETGAPVPAKKGPSKRLVMAVTLNLAALVIVGFVLWPGIGGAQANPGQAQKTEPGLPAAAATPAAVAVSAPAAMPSSVPGAPTAAAPGSTKKSKPAAKAPTAKPVIKAKAKPGSAGMEPAQAKPAAG